MSMKATNAMVRCYFNLHKLKISVQAKNERGSWIVIKHVNQIHLSQVKFKVSKAGRERVLREKRKNVHAFVYGYEVKSPVLPYMMVVKYNPYKYETFVDGEDNPVFNLDGCTIQDRIIMGGCGLDIE